MWHNALLSAGLLLCAAFAAAGQEAAAAPEFEAASVKPAEPLNVGPMMAGGRMQIRLGCSVPDPGRFACSGMPLRTLLAKAYGFKNYQISGPGWMDSERFDIVAKVPAGATPEQVDLMLQKLLVERFQMTVHRETRELPVYALVVGRNGPKLKEAAGGGNASPTDEALADRGAPPPPPPPPPPPGGGSGQVGVMTMRGGPGAKGDVTMTMRNGLNELVGRQATAAALAAVLSTQVNRPVVDDTGLKGDYDFTVDFAADDTVGPGGALGGIVLSGPGPGGTGAAPGAETRDPAPAASIFSAIQNQLGLKLEARRLPVETIVVDRAEKTPAEN